MGGGCSTAKEEPFISVPDHAPPIPSNEHGNQGSDMAPTNLAMHAEPTPGPSAAESAPSTAPDALLPGPSDAAPSEEQASAVNKTDAWWSSRVEEESMRQEEALASAKEELAASDAAAVLEAQREDLAAREAESRASRTSRTSLTASANPKHMTAGQLRRKLNELGVSVPEDASKQVLQDLVIQHMPASDAAQHNQA